MSDIHAHDLVDLADFGDLVAADGSRQDRRLFYDADVYEAERRRIFQRCWLFVGHESQIPNPGDFVSSYIGEEPVDASGDTVTVRSNFVIHRSRLESDVEQFVGTRRDTLRRTETGWLIVRRDVLLNAAVLSAVNLEIFF